MNKSIHAFSSKAIHQTDNQYIIYHEQYSFDWHNNDDWDIIEKHNNPKKATKKQSHRRSLKSYTVIEGASIHDDTNSNSIRDVYKNGNIDKLGANVAEQLFDSSISDSSGIEIGDIYDQLNKQKYININPILKCSKPLPTDNYVRLCVRWDNGDNFHFNFDQQHPQVVNKKNHHIHININNDSCWNHHHQLHNLLHYDNIKNVYDHSKYGMDDDGINLNVWSEGLMSRLFEEMWKENKYFKLLYSNKNKKCQNINGILLCMTFGVDPTQKHHLKFHINIPRLMRKRKRKEGNGNRMLNVEQRKTIQPYTHNEAITKSSLSPSLTTQSRNHSWNTIWLRWSNSNDWDYVQIIKHVNHIQCTHSIPGLLYYDLCVMLNRDGIHFRLFRLDPKIYDQKMMGAIVTTLFALKAKENKKYQYRMPEFVEKKPFSAPKKKVKIRKKTKVNKLNKVHKKKNEDKNDKTEKRTKRKLLETEEEELIELLNDIIELSDTEDFYQNMDLSDFWSFESDDDWSTISYHDQNEADFDVKEFELDDESELEEEFISKIFKTVSNLGKRAYQAAKGPLKAIAGRFQSVGFVLCILQFIIFTYSNICIHRFLELD